MKIYNTFLVLTYILLSGITKLEAYKVSVIEYTPKVGKTVEDTFLRNLNVYEIEISEASDRGVNIIVFPEYGITGGYADPKQYSVEISDENYIVRNLTTLAKKHKIYIVVNLLEQVHDGHVVKYYNTNIVFATNGTIIARYRKINLSNAEEKYLTPGNETVTFSTDFGINFGILTSDDIFFATPSQDVLVSAQVTEVIYVTSEFDVMSMFIKMNILHQYAVTNNVNVLASNTCKRTDCGVGGIFSMDGSIELRVKNRRIIRRIPERGLREKLKFTDCTNSSFPFLVDASREKNFISYYFNSTKFNFNNGTKIDLKKSQIKEKVCDKDFCCYFNISIEEHAVHEVYRLVTYDGVQNLDGVNKHLRFCGLLTCSNDSEENCTLEMNSTTKFGQIEIEGTFPENKTLRMPLILTSNSYSIENVYCNKNNNVLFRTVSAQRYISTFGIVQLDFETVENSEQNFDNNKSVQSLVLTQNNNAEVILNNIVFLIVQLVFFYWNGWGWSNIY